MTDLIEVRRCPSAREADRLALVLAAMGIASRQVPMPLGVGLFVAAPDAAQARHELAAYEHENAPRRRAMAAPKRLHEAWPAALAYALLLLFFFGAARRDLWGIDWLQAGAVQAGLMRAGEWWRAVTALTLHLDHGHLVGNLFAGAAIGTVAAQLLGPGLAWLAILLAGSLANLLAALLRAPDHAAIGASTAVFAALGIVSAFTRQRRWLQRDLRLRRLAPLGAGVLLLAYLGFGGERTDVGAHVAGFAVGLACGWALARWHERVPSGMRPQWVYGAIAFWLIVVSWTIALS